MNGDGRVVRMTQFLLFWMLLLAYLTTMNQADEEYTVQDFDEMLAVSQTDRRYMGYRVHSFDLLSSQSEAGSIELLVCPILHRD